MKSYFLKLQESNPPRWVSSPTHTTTDIPALRASFGTKWGNPEEQNRDSTKARLEKIHGPLMVEENDK